LPKFGKGFPEGTPRVDVRSYNYVTYRIGVRMFSNLPIGFEKPLYVMRMPWDSTV